MKRLLALILALFMLLSGSAAVAEEMPVAGLVRLLDAENGFVACGVLLQDETIVTAAVLPEAAQLQAIAADGTVGNAVPDEEPVQHGLMALQAEGMTGGLQTAVLTDGACRACWLGEQGIEAVPAEVGGTILWQEEKCRLITAEESLPLGAALLDDEGQAMAVLAAVWADSRNTWVAVPLEENTEAADAQKTAGSNVAEWKAPDQKGSFLYTDDSPWLTGFTLTAENAVVTVDYSAAPVNGLTDDSCFTVLCEMDGNPYFSYTPSSQGETGAELLVVPGHTYYFWVLHTQGAYAGDPKPDHADAQMITLPPAERMTDYNYSEKAFYLGTLPMGSDEYSAELAEPIDQPLMDVLNDYTREVFLQVISTYEVEAEVTDTLMGVLETPEGYTFTTEGSFAYLPEIQNEDAWHMNVTKLFMDYARSSMGLCDGTYTLSYYIGGKLADSMSFTLD